MKNIFKYGIMAFAAVTAVTSCDWTDPEPVGTHYDHISEADPDAYQQYLSNLVHIATTATSRCMHGLPTRLRLAHRRIMSAPYLTVSTYWCLQRLMP